MDALTEYVSKQYDFFQTSLERIKKPRPYLNYGYRSARGQSYEDKQEELCRQVYKLAEIGAGDTVVDVGFGSGEQDFMLAREFEFKKLMGFNIAAKQVEFANNRAEQEGLTDKLVFHRSPAEDMSVLKDASIDKVISIECAFYFDRPEFYKEAARVLKPGGKLALADISFNPKLKFLTRKSEDLSRVGVFEQNKENWEKHFNTVSVRSIRSEARPGAQTTVFKCLTSLFHNVSFAEKKTWLKMAYYTQLVVLGLLTGLLRYDLILLEKS